MSRGSPAPLRLSHRAVTQEDLAKHAHETKSATDASLSASTSSSPPSSERLTRSVPPLGASRKPRRPREQRAATAERSADECTHCALGTVGPHPCPRCETSSLGADVHALGYWPAWNDMVRVCTAKCAGPARVCGWTWIDTEPHARCTCRECLCIERRFGEFYYVCTACESIGFNTINSEPPSEAQ